MLQIVGGTAMHCNPGQSGIRKNTRLIRRYCVLFPIGAALAILLLWTGPAFADFEFVPQTAANDVVAKLAETHGESQRGRIERGVDQVARFWRAEDGTIEEFQSFCLQQFLADSLKLQQTADRFEDKLTDLFGHYREVIRNFSWHVDVVDGDILPVDHLFNAYSVFAHFSDDMFSSRLAFAALLNFPRYSLDEKIALGSAWDDRQWAQARLTDIFDTRVPASVSQGITAAFARANSYISGYNIHMHHVLTDEGARMFPEGMRLISHWNLRDELKSQYGEPDGRAKQEMIYDIMLKIIRQEIPEVVIDNPAVDWWLADNRVTVSPVRNANVPAEWDEEREAGEEISADREPDTRYQRLLDVFKAVSAGDPYTPEMPTFIDRRFEGSREIREESVVNLLVTVLGSPVMKDVGAIVAQRLGRPLRPYDIWYDGFKQRSTIPEDELTQLVNEKYPSVEAFEAELPQILGQLGFDAATVDFLAANIEVDPSRGAGHAMGPGQKSDKAHLRTRIPTTGMDYKGYNIATHELGHSVEQVFSLHGVDHLLLRGVPGAAFTECFAFLFQDRDLELLGLATPSESTADLMMLDKTWSAFEISGVSLLDIRVWHWMYDNPDATPAELREAVIGIARDIWNEYYAPVFGFTDCEILAVYSHMIDAGMYLPSYAVGELIAFQIEEYVRDRNLAEEMPRMCSIGRIVPSFWMTKAVGEELSAEPLLTAAARAVTAVKD
jgi:hypothetical protein